MGNNVSVFHRCQAHAGGTYCVRTNTYRAKYPSSPSSSTGSGQGLYPAARLSATALHLDTLKIPMSPNSLVRDWDEVVAIKSRFSSSSSSSTSPPAPSPPSSSSSSSSMMLSPPSITRHSDISCITPKSEEVSRVAAKATLTTGEEDNLLAGPDSRTSLPTSSRRGKSTESKTPRTMASSEEFDPSCAALLLNRSSSRKPMDDSGSVEGGSTETRTMAPVIDNSIDGTSFTAHKLSRKGKWLRRSFTLEQINTIITTSATMTRPYDKENGISDKRSTHQGNGFDDPPMKSASHVKKTVKTVLRWNSVKRFSPGGGGKIIVQDIARIEKELNVLTLHFKDTDRRSLSLKFSGPEELQRMAPIFHHLVSASTHGCKQGENTVVVRRTTGKKKKIGSSKKHIPASKTMLKEHQQEKAVLQPPRSPSTPTMRFARTPLSAMR